MEIPESLYNWLQQTTVLRSPPKITDGKIHIQEADAQRLENGTSFLRLLSRLATLHAEAEPTLALHESYSRSARLHNWNLLSTALEQFGILLDSNLKTLIVAGDRQLILEVLKDIKVSEESFLHSPHKKNKKKKNKVYYEGAMFLGNVNSNSLLSESEGCLQFLILNCCHHFKVKPKQAAGLFTQKARFLECIILKGLRGDFHVVARWFEDILLHVEVLAKLIPPELPQGSLQLVLNCFKFGLDCKDPRIFKLSCACLKSLHSLLIFQEQEIWNWFEQNKVFEILFNKLDDNVLHVLYEFGKPRLFHMFGTLYLDHFKNIPNTYARFFQSLTALESHKEEFVNSGIVKMWIEHALNMSSNGKSVQIKVSALCFLCDLWFEFPDYIDDLYGLSIMNGIKKGDYPKWFRIPVLAKAFRLLSVFMYYQRPYADIILKNLFFILEDNFKTDLLREFILFNLCGIIRENSGVEIPIDNVIKHMKSIQPNCFDFDFLVVYARRPHLPISHVLQILELMGNFYLTDIRYSTVSSILIVLLVGRFSDELVVQQYIYNLLMHGFTQLFKRKHDFISYRNLVLGLAEKIINIGSEELKGLIAEILNSAKTEAKKYKMQLLSGLNFLINMCGIIDNRSEMSLSSSVRIESRAINHIEMISKKRRELESQKRSLSEQQSQHKEKVKNSLKKQIENRRVELGVDSKSNDTETVILGQNSQKQRKLFFEPEDESEFERDFISIITNKYSRVTKFVYAKYAKHIEKGKPLMKEGQAISLLRENGISKDMASGLEVKDIYSYLLQRYKITCLNYETFLSFLYHVSLLVYSEESLPSAFVLEKLVLMFENTVPSHLFEPDPGAGDADIVRTLNLQLAENPDIEMPEGYRRINDLDLKLVYEVPEALDVPYSFKVCIEILDEIFFEEFKSHIIEPEVVIDEVYRAKGILNKPQLHKSSESVGVPSNKASYKNLPLPAYLSLSPVIKLEMNKILGQSSNDDLLEIARLVDDLVHSVSEGSQTVISRSPKAPKDISNSVKTERQRAENKEIALKEIKEERRRNRMAELKSVIQKKTESLPYFKEETPKKIPNNNFFNNAKKKIFEKSIQNIIKKVPEQNPGRERGFDRNRWKNNDISVKEEGKKVELKASNTKSKNNKPEAPLPEIKNNHKGTEEGKNEGELPRKLRKHSIFENKRISEESSPKPARKHSIVNSNPLQDVEETQNLSFDAAWADKKVQKSFKNNKKALQAIFDKNATKDGTNSALPIIQFNSFLVQTKIVPDLINAGNIQPLYKSVLSNKSGLNLEEFKQILLKIALQAKLNADAPSGSKDPKYHLKLDALIQWISNNPTNKK